MTTNDDERVQPTPDDWQKLCEIEVLPEVLTEDALQKAARSRARERQCRRGACTFTFALDGSARTRTPSGLSLGRAVRSGPAAEGTEDGALQGGLASTAWCSHGARAER